MPGRPRHAFVLGGGVAGIAAALQLRDGGSEVTLFEARRCLGGRVFSLDDRGLGEIDNGPHVMLGCYEHMRRLLRRLGTEGDFDQPARLSLVYREEGGRRSELALSRLPVPLAMPAAVLGWKALSLGERLRALRGMVSSVRGAPEGWSIDDWVMARGQHGAPRDFMWDPLCRAIMNADPAHVSADLFLRTLRRAFSGSARRSAIWVPRRPWARIVGEPGRATLEQVGANVQTGRRAVAVELAGARVRALAFGDGERLEVSSDDVVVSALPWHRLARLLGDAWSAPARTFGGRAIVNVYFEVAETAALPVEGALVALVRGSPFHYLYRTPDAPAHRFALIAGASPELDNISVAEIAALARGQLARFYPDHPVSEDAKVRVTKESDATLLAAPGSTQDRPPPGLLAGCDNLLVCGDWTQTDLPSTLEGAAESAVRMLAAYDGRPAAR